MNALSAMMSRRSRVPAILSSCVALSLLTTARADSRDDDAPLAGPPVERRQVAPSIVERTFEGSLKRPEVRPEEAAVRKLDLSPDELARVEDVLAERSAMLDTVVRGNIELLVRMNSARIAGDQPAVNESTRMLREALRPLAASGRLSERLTAAMTPEHAEQFRWMVRDYLRALAREGSRSRPSGDPMDSQDEPSRGAVARVMVELLVQEVRRSYDRIAAEAQERLDALVERLELTPEQQSAVGELAREFGEKTKLNPTPAQRAELFSRVVALLTPAQRARAIELALRGK